MGLSFLCGPECLCGLQGGTVPAFEICPKQGLPLRSPTPTGPSLQGLFCGAGGGCEKTQQVLGAKTGGGKHLIFHPGKNKGNRNV